MTIVCMSNRDCRDITVCLAFLSTVSRVFSLVFVLSAGYCNICFVHELLKI